MPGGGVARPRGGRAAAVASLVLLIVGVGAVGGWALRTMLAPAPDVLDAPAYTLVESRQGTVGHSLRLNTTAAWASEAVLTNQAAGTITSINWPGWEEAEQGSPVYTVDLRPVVVAEGAVPAFRDLAAGQRGEDVRQLQEMLADIGHFSGAADGEFGWATVAAVTAWQRDLGVEPNGTVRRGDIIFVPSLPSRLALVTDIQVGSVLSGGEAAVRVLPSAPEFTITLPEGQARLVAVGMAVEIQPDEAAPWLATIEEIRRDSIESGAGLTAILTSDGPGPVCGEACADIPLGDPTLLPSLIHVVPETTGVTVPVAALVTTADGTTVVVTAAGELREVTVRAAASGVAVVDGLPAGVQVRTPGESLAASR